MIEAIIDGEEDPEQLAELARRKLRGKPPELKKALNGEVTAHHRFMLKILLEQVDFLEGQIKKLTERIEELMVPSETAIEHLDSVPGINRRAAEAILAETGDDMEQFPSADHLSSWAGMSPGNNESAGMRMSGKTTKGKKWLRRTMVECGWSAGQTKGTYFKSQYKKLAGRRGRKRAIVAVGHSLLVTIYYLLKRGVFNEELGEDHFERLAPERATQYHVRKLEKPGYMVNLEKDEEPAVA